MRRKSKRQKLIEKIKTLLREELKKERGNRCEICGQSGGRLGLFHILSVGKYPRLMFSKENILLSHWYPCHYLWHHDYFRAKGIDRRIQKLRGKNYETKLKMIEKTMPKLTMVYLETLYEAMKGKK